MVANHNINGVLWQEFICSLSSSADLRPFLPDPLQRFSELRTALWSRQVTPPKDAADPPNLKTAKDQGDKTQLDVSPVQVLHYACCCAFRQRLVCWCSLNAH